MSKQTALAGAGSIKSNLNHNLDRSLNQSSQAQNDYDLNFPTSAPQESSIADAVIKIKEKCEQQLDEVNDQIHDQCVNLKVSSGKQSHENFIYGSTTHAGDGLGGTFSNENRETCATGRNSNTLRGSHSRGGPKDLQSWKALKKSNRDLMANDDDYPTAHSSQQFKRCAVPVKNLNTSQAGKSNRGSGLLHTNRDFLNHSNSQASTQNSNKQSIGYQNPKLTASRSTGRTGPQKPKHGKENITAKTKASRSKENLGARPPLAGRPPALLENAGAAYCNPSAMTDEILRKFPSFNSGRLKQASLAASATNLNVRKKSNAGDHRPAKNLTSSIITPKLSNAGDYASARGKRAGFMGMTKSCRGKLMFA